MSDLNFESLFHPQTLSLHSFLSRTNHGFLIPLYQRPYSWDTDNIDQLFEDLSDGVACDPFDEEALRFLGTVITLQVPNPKQRLKDHEVTPTAVDQIIDGQQRIATIALAAALIHQHIDKLSKRITKKSGLEELESVAQWVKKQLRRLFSVDFDLDDAVPRWKPIVVRDSDDRWNLKGDDSSYGWEISSFLARVIRSIESTEVKFPAIPKGSIVGRNLRRIERHLKYFESPIEGSGLAAVPPIEVLLRRTAHSTFWGPENREQIQIKLEKIDPANPSRAESAAHSLVRLFALSHFLAQRCCVTVIRPKSEDFAFDMFQSLNSTGSPLTALETFKPLVVREVGADKYEASVEAKYLANADKWISQATNAATKSRLTSDLVSLLSHSWCGEKLSNRFSTQRTWLIKSYTSSTADGAKLFLDKLSATSKYLTKIRQFDITQSPCLPGLDGADANEKDLATLCVMYLYAVNHEMAGCVLNQFYARVLKEDTEGAKEEFIGAAKALAAFYTFWRGTQGTSGLDEFYRQLMRPKISLGEGEGISRSGHGHGWASSGGGLSLGELVTILRAKIKEFAPDRETWVTRASTYVDYSQRNLCKFLIIIAAHDTIVDNTPGLMKVASQGTADVLKAGHWNSDSFQSVEHIAPQKNPAVDPYEVQIYEQGMVDKIGNLTLLPQGDNTRLSNLHWPAKWLHYKHLALQDPDAAEELQAQAVARGLKLSDSDIERFRKARYNNHIRPVAEVGIDGHWTAELVTRRSRRICEIAYDRLTRWFETDADSV